MGRTVHDNSSLGLNCYWAQITRCYSAHIEEPQGHEAHVEVECEAERRRSTISSPPLRVAVRCVAWHPSSPLSSSFLRSHLPVSASPRSSIRPGRALDRLVAMATDAAAADKSSVFRKLRAKSDNKVRRGDRVPLHSVLIRLRREFRFAAVPSIPRRLIAVPSLPPCLCVCVCADVLRLQRQEPYLGLRHLRRLPLHRLLCRPPQPWRPRFICQV